ncbi:indolepyruvate ferredoxin oxidoreductase subunit alpha [Shumkonia mesophila]|uniref:indolepyruvate ferredoxin oxidoreductase subunit alpha n=1 Tax=Shumkonia mesophila TaxID=2838854 RepID=UPI0029347C74|nr:ferredoxin family protein [Shumkonia mesophila]
MKIDPDKCTSCLSCIPYCPMNCIAEGDDGTAIDEDECVDCGVCRNVEVCPEEAIYMPAEAFEYPRAIRMQFSDPSVQHPNLKAWGRGTEEAKTNDVTGKFGKGDYGMLFEFGRPGTGARFREIEKITTAICAMGIDILEDNPISGLIADKTTGTIRPEFRDEKILSAILEIRIDDSQLAAVVDKVIPLLDDVDTVVSVGLVSRFDDNDELPVIGALRSLGITPRPNAKINVGLGRPIVE